MSELHTARPDFPPELLTHTASDCPLNVFTYMFPILQGNTVEWLRVWSLELDPGLGLNLSNATNYV